MNSILFIITLTAEILTTLAVIVSIAYPQQRIWPPRQERAWGQYLMWFLFMLSAAGTFLLGIADWGTFIIPTWICIAFGAPLGLTGISLAIWAMVALGIAPTSGKADKLVHGGPYRFSRNPQYVGFLLGLFGWAILVNSSLTLLVAIAGSVPLLLVPFAEEAWLVEIYGSEYEQYKQDVSRFL